MYKRLTLALVLLAALSSSKAAWAQDCTAPVVDETNILGNRLTQVQRAVTRLKENGADTYVRIYPHLQGERNLENLEAKIRRGCANWQNAKGERKGNIIIYLLARREEQTRLFHGSVWNNIRPQMNDVVHRILIPQLASGIKTGDLGTGVALFTDALADVVKQEMSARSTPAPTQTPVERVIVEKQTQPTDYSWIGTAFKWLLGVVIVVGVVGIGIAASASRKKRQTARAKAQDAMKSAASMVTGTANALSDVEGRCETYAPMATSEEATDFSTRLGDARRKVSAATRRYDVLEQNTQLGNHLRTMEEYNLITRNYNDVIAQYSTAGEVISDLNHKLNLFERRIATLSVVIKASTDAIAKAEKQLQTATKQGYKTEQFEKRLTVARLNRERAEKIAKTEPSQAVNLAEQARDTANEVAAEAENLPVRLSKILEQGRATNQRLVVAAVSVGDGRKTFEAITREHARKAWEPLEGNGGRAEAKLVEAKAAIEGAAKLSVMEVQDWQGTEALLTTANNELDRVDSFMRSITELAKTLNEARTDAARVIQSTTNDIDRAQKYIEECERTAPIDVQIKQQLSQAKKLLQDARQESRTDIKRHQPDYLNAIKLAMQAHDLTDVVLKDAREDHDRHLRAKEKAEDKINAAKRRISKAEEYYADNPRYVDEEATELLKQAQDNLKQAQEAQNYTLVWELAEKADETGKQAYSVVHDSVIESHSSHGGSIGSGSWNHANHGGGGSIVSEITNNLGGGGSIGGIFSGHGDGGGGSIGGSFGGDSGGGDGGGGGGGGD